MEQQNFTPAAVNYANGNKQAIKYALTNNLPAYVSQERYPLLIENIYQWESSVNLFNVLQGIRCETNITTLNIDPQFQACACGFNPLGTTTLESRKINVECIEIEDEWCAKDLICTYGQWYVNRFTPGRESLESTFENTFIRGYLQAVNREFEKLIYQGDTTSSTPNLARFDGLIKVLTTAGSPTLTTTGSYIEQLLQVAANIPENAYERGRVAILVGMDVFRTLNTGVFFLNNRNLSPQDTAEFGNTRPYIILPGTNIPVYGVYGLNGTNRAIAGSLNNIYFATDLLSDSEVLDFWYSKDFDIYRLRMLWFAGIQVAFPDETLLVTLDPATGAAISGGIPVTITNDPLVVGTNPAGANGGLLTDTNP